ncbi:MAG: radical SAM protein [Candidatus Brocadiaceae bacterium]|nr:radical SAM protein [Candidatus Brocadiaceae bacterium]
MGANEVRAPAVKPIAGTEFSPREIEDAVRRGGLLSLELEMTRACNLRCIYCYAQAGEPMENEIRFEELVDAVQQATDLGARKMVVLGGGEPCLYREFRRLVDYLADLDTVVEVFTNGTLIDRDLAGFLYDRGVSVVVKRNSGDPQTQDALAGSPGTFDQIRNGLNLLLEAGYPDENHGMGVQTVICRRNLAEIPQLWRWARRRGITPYFECMTLQGRAAHTESLHVTTAEVRRVFAELCRIDREEFGLAWTPHPPLVALSCSRHLYSMVVKANGDLYPCVGVTIPVGNIRRERLADVIRNSPVIDDLRHVYERIKGPCRNCRYNGLCYGCRGNAYQLTGDYLASDPCCWVPGEAAEEAQEDGCAEECSRGPASEPNVLCRSLCDFMRTQLVAEGVVFDEDTSFAAVGLDSLGLMELLLFVERRFGVEVPEAELTRANLHSVRAFAECVGRLSGLGTAASGEAGGP